MPKPQHPLAVALADGLDGFDYCIVEMIDTLQNAALVVACNRPLDRGKALIKYLTAKRETLVKDDPAYNCVTNCLEHSTPNKVARTFETNYQFYFGSAPYKGAKPFNGALARAHKRIEESVG